MRREFHVAARYLTAQVRRLSKNVFSTLGLSLLWMAIASVVLRVVGVEVDTASLVVPLSVDLLLSSSDSAANFMLTNPLALFFSALVFAPIVEEIAFRLIPLSLVRGAHPDKVRAVLLGVSGLLFGVMHGGLYRIAAQGVLGVLLGLLYLRNGPNQYASYFSCVAAHMAYNFVVVALQFV